MSSFRPTDEEIRARAVALIRAHGPNHAARTFGVNRMTVLSMAAGAFVMPATFALVRERLTASPQPTEAA